MHLSKTAVLAASLTLVLAGVARAEDPELTNRKAIVVDPAGKTKVVQLDEAAHAMVMKNAKVVSNRVLIYPAHGKVYIVTDRSLPKGRRLFDTVPDLPTTF
jgi:hypothetical protein